MSLVQDRHRPTLREAVAPLPRAARIAILGVVALLVVALLARVLWPEARGIEVIREQAPAFNFARTADLRETAPEGDQYVRFERRRPDGLFVQSFAVAPLELPAYRGDVAGILPVAAEAELAGLARRHAELDLVQEGKTRINEVPGYQLLFTARQGERRIFGRSVLLPAPEPGARTGVRLEMLATYAAGVSRAEEVGVRGVIKRPYRTFRFGSDPP